MKRGLWAHVVIVCALLLPAAAGARAGAEPAPVDSPLTSQPAGQAGATSRLYPEQMDPPESCGVPLSGPFGQDVEILLNDVLLDVEPGWYARGVVRCAECVDAVRQPASDVAAASLGTEKVAAVWRENGVTGHEGELTYQIWDASGGGDEWGPIAHNGPFPDADGWAAPPHYETVHSGDVDGDGIAEVLARSVLGMDTWRFNGGGWDPVTLSNGPFSDVDGWNAAEHYRTIHSADINGDGVDELLGRDDPGVVIWRVNTGTAAWEPVTGTGWPFSDAAGWDQPQYYATIHSADIDGDGVDELLGRWETGMQIYRYNPTAEAWQAVPGADAPFTDGQGWWQPQYYETIHSADIDGDGRAELLGRGITGMSI